MKANNEYIVLLHGIIRSARSMNKLETHFSNKGYIVINIDYPSSKYPLEQLIDYIHNEISTPYKDTTKKIHFIGHSMGNLLIRGYIHKYHPAHLGRVVMIAPPNRGSQIADFLKNNYFYKWIYGPAGQQLITSQEAIIPILGNATFDVGVIAGDCSLDPLSSWLLSGKNDGKVTIESTKLETMSDHIIIHGTHTFIMRNKEAILQAEHFIEQGRFNKNS